MNDVEEWRDIDGFPIYQVSDLGNVKSIGRQGVTKYIEEKILSWGKNPAGYNIVSLTNKKKKIKGKSFQVHRLQATAFIPNPENKPWINHKNGIKTDNRLENLEWVTEKENSIHRFEVLKQEGTWLGRKDTQHPLSKPVLQYDLEGNFIREWGSASEASRQLGINVRNISSCCNGKRDKAGNFIWKFKVL